MNAYWKWMTNPSRPLWKNLGLFFILMGPGIITSNVDNDAGGITTYSLAGAHYRTQPALDADPDHDRPDRGAGNVRAHGGRDRQGPLGPDPRKLRRQDHLLPDDRHVSDQHGQRHLRVRRGRGRHGDLRRQQVHLGAHRAVLVWAMVVKGTYKQVEKIFLVACLFYIAYVVSGFVVHPDWARSWRLSSPPDLEPSELTMVIGLVGTTIAPWMQFYLQASIVEKGIRIERTSSPVRRRHRLDGGPRGGFLHHPGLCRHPAQAGIAIETASDAALALAPLAGHYCTYLFAFGLLNASLFAASILPLSTAY